jgi:hypothetical protein
MTVVPRYLIEKGPDDVKTAFGAIPALCEKHGASQITLVIPQKQGWERSIVGEMFTIAERKALTKGEPLRWGRDGPFVRLESSETFRPIPGLGLVFGAHISGAAMAKVDDSPARAILYLPWTEDEGREWKATWRPETIGRDTWRPNVAELPEKVQARLTELTKQINLSTGLGHPSDKASAKKAIADLRAGGHDFDAGEIKRWAKRHGWRSDAATELEAIAKQRR